MSLKDERTLTMTAPTLVVAAEGGARVVSGWPNRAITEVEFQPANQALRVHFGTGPTAQHVDVAGPHLAALIIGYLIAVGVPMPSRAPKAITVTETTVVLRLTSEQVLPQRRRPMANAGASAGGRR